MCLRVSRVACDDYQPDYDHPSERGQLCYGMGHSAPCRNCGLTAMYHIVVEHRYEGRHRATTTH